MEPSEFFRRIMLTPNTLIGHVTGVTYDSTTGKQTTASVQVGGSTMRVPLSVFHPPLAIGDSVRLEQQGNAASANYDLAGLSNGVRTDSGVMTVLDPATIGGFVYGGGDVVFGRLSTGNIYVEYATGRLYHRIGANVYGIEYPDGSQLFGAATFSGDWTPSGPNVYITATTVKLRYGTSDSISLDVNGRIIASRRITAGTSDDVAVLNAEDATYRLYAGSATPASAPFRVTKAGALTATSAVITGTINAGAGTFNGLVQIGASTPHLHLDGASALIESSNYVAGSTGWRITALGDAEFGNVNVRGAISATVFNKGIISAFAGGLVVAKSAGKLDAAYTVNGTMTIESPPGGGWAFATNDIVRIKAEYSGGIGDTWVVVTRTGTENVYTTVRQSGTNSIIYPAGTCCVDYGVSGQGYFAVAADGTFGASAAWVLRSHAGAPWSAETTHVWAGTDGRLYAGGGATSLDANGIDLIAPNAYARTSSVTWVTSGTGTLVSEVSATSTLILNSQRVITHPIAGHNSEAIITASAPATQQATASLEAYCPDDPGLIALISAVTDSDALHTERLVFTGASLQHVELNSGGLGIGTADPVAPLHVVGNGLFADPATLGAECLYNGALTAGTSWLADGCFSLTADSAIYTFAGSGMASIYQLEANLANKGAGNRWYLFQYTITANTLVGGVGFLVAPYWVDSNLALEITIGTHSIFFKSCANPDLFHFYVGANAGSLTVDSLSLKPVVGGDLLVSGTTRTKDLDYVGELKPWRNGAQYTGYSFVPLITEVTNTSYNGDAVNVGNYQLDLQAAGWGLPAGIKAVAARLAVLWSSASSSRYAALGPYSGAVSVVVRSMVANYYNEAAGIVPCDVNGDIWLNISGANASNVHIVIWGYYI